MECISAALSRAGPDHDSNEDFMLADDVRSLYIVSDGVGSSHGAGLASRIAVESAARSLAAAALPGQATALEEALRRAVRAASQALVAGASEPRLRSMAATLTALVIAGDHGGIAHIGDSRAYLWREQQLLQLSRDHSLAFEQYELGVLTKEEIRNHPNQRLLTRSLSASRRIAIADIESFTVRRGDRFLLCSDGLNKELDDGQLAAILGRDQAPAAHVSELVAAAVAAGASDDITVIVLDARSPEQSRNECS